MPWVAGKFLPSWALTIECVKLDPRALWRLDKGAGQWRASVFVKVALEICAVNFVSPSESALMAPCEIFYEYCCDSLILVSQRHETDSLDITVFSEYEEENASVSEFPVREHQLDDAIDCWSVSSAYVNKTHLNEMKVKFGSRSRSMSTPW